MTLAYKSDLVEIHCGDCLAILPELEAGAFDAVVTDPPYPNNAGHFIDGIPSAYQLLAGLNCRVAGVFWSELEQPPVELPLVAVHIWHRSNVNGRPYEPIYHYATDRVKRRSEIKAAAAVFDGVGPGCREYAGHPTQKPAVLMRWLIHRVGVLEGATVLDPFAGSGTTAVACVQTGRKCVLIEREARYVEIAIRRVKEVEGVGSLFENAQPSGGHQRCLM